MLIDLSQLPSAPLASSAQRHALYRLGYATSLVRRLTVEQASQLIKLAAAARAVVGKLQTVEQPNEVQK